MTKFNLMHKDAHLFQIALPDHLHRVARSVYLYSTLWVPPPLHVAGSVTAPLGAGISRLEFELARSESSDAPGKWWCHGELLDISKQILSACNKYENARVLVVEVSGKAA